MALLTKQQILEASDLKRELVTVPEWGGDVFVRVMTGTERDAWECDMVNAREEAKKRGLYFTVSNLRAKMCAICLCGDDGKRMFTDAEVIQLGAKSGAALDRVFTVAQRLNRLTTDDMEQLTKN